MSKINISKTFFEQIQFGSITMLGVDENTKFELLGYVYTDNEYFCVFYNPIEDIYRKTHYPINAYVGQDEMCRVETAMIGFSNGSTSCFAKCEEPRRVLHESTKEQINKVNEFIANIESVGQIYLK